MKINFDLNPAEIANPLCHTPFILSKLCCCCAVVLLAKSKIREAAAKTKHLQAVVSENRTQREDAGFTRPPTLNKTKRFLNVVVPVANISQPADTQHEVAFLLQTSLSN